MVIYKEKFKLKLQNPLTPTYQATDLHLKKFMSNYGRDWVFQVRFIITVTLIK